MGVRPVTTGEDGCAPLAADAVGSAVAETLVGQQLPDCCAVQDPESTRRLPSGAAPARPSDVQGRVPRTIGPARRAAACRRAWVQSRCLPWFRIPRAFRARVLGMIVAPRSAAESYGGCNEETLGNARRRFAWDDPRGRRSRQCRAAMPRRLRGPEERLRAGRPRGEAVVQAGLPRERGPHHAGRMHEDVLGHVSIDQDQLSGRPRELSRYLRAPVIPTAEQLPRQLRQGPGDVHPRRGERSEDLRGGMPERLGPCRVSQELYGRCQARCRELRL